ncbi:peptidoglycan-binding protein [Streptomyces sp. NPDC048389]|uniref:peptidoglycan-binding protein n=1 Tax=Streptomyces sp. NPDC048389 TaxID=3154622 RepID=UPI0034542950
MKLVRRSAWGAPASSPAAPLPRARGVKVHWLGGPYAVGVHSGCAAKVRAIRAAHLAHATENYIDIAYNAIACPHGHVFEGRGAGRRSGANGNLTLNTGHYAVLALHGTTTGPPGDMLLHALADAIGWLQAEGAGDEVLGHRDGHNTQCPGDDLYAWVRAGAPRPGGELPQGGHGARVPLPPPRYQVTIDGLAYGHGARGEHVTAVGRALVAAGHGDHYRVGPGPTWSDADTLNYASWQRSLGYSGADADGVPGKSSLRLLLGDLPTSRPVVDLSRLVTAARSDPAHLGRPITYPAVRVVENALVAEGLLNTRYADGHYGTATVDAYAGWQRRCGYRGQDADGIPGKDSLRRLGARHGFDVKD